MSAQQFPIGPDSKGKRLDVFLQGLMPETSRTEVQRWITDGLVTVPNERAVKSLRLEEGMVVHLAVIPEKPASELLPEAIPLDIVYQDDDLLVINKPRNLVVHPGAGVRTGTLAAGLLHHYGTLSTVNGPMRPGIVHRLDKDTAGLMVVARNDATHRALSLQLEERDIHRVYQALVWHHPASHSGTVDAPIDRDPTNRTRMAVVEGGREARTHWTALETFRYATFVELELDTGRTHQIRVHMKHIGCPVVGDFTYEGGSFILQRIAPIERTSAQQLLALSPVQMLQAVRLAFTHPTTGEYMQFEVPLESVFAASLEHLRATASESAPVLPEEAPPEPGSWAVPDIIPEREEESYSAFPEPVDRPTRFQRLQEAKRRRAAKKERFAAIARGEPDPGKYEFIPSWSRAARNAEGNTEDFDGD